MNIRIEKIKNIYNNLSEDDKKNLHYNYFSKLSKNVDTLLIEVINYIKIKMGNSLNCEYKKTKKHYKITTDFTKTRYINFEQLKRQYKLEKSYRFYGIKELNFLL